MIKGHARILLDAERMWSYPPSQSVEYVELERKTPWIAEIDQLNELEPVMKKEKKEPEGKMPEKPMPGARKPIKETKKKDGGKKR